MAKKVLVVDDEADVRKFISVVLEQAGHEVITAADGRQALEVTRQQHPDLVILDLQMPEATGTDFYRKLARDKELGQVPIIVVSGLAGRHLAVREPVAVFDKPIDPDEFLEAVNKALG
ncbi:MAG: response regulator [Deltaproteobacteria bacterium]|nr:MAG: response regulator [Deltaproteobacteria bacterium]